MMKNIVENAVDPLHFDGTQFSVDEAVKYLNDRLSRDGFNLIIDNKLNRFFIDAPELNIIDGEKLYELRSEFILDQINKAKDKLVKGDYDGAITNARSLCESVQAELIRINNGIVPNSGDLNDFFKEVRKILKMNIDKQCCSSNEIIQVLSGLHSIITGFAGISNNMYIPLRAEH